MYIKTSVKCQNAEAESKEISRGGYIYLNIYTYSTLKVLTYSYLYIYKNRSNKSVRSQVPVLLSPRHWHFYLLAESRFVPECGRRAQKKHKSESHLADPPNTARDRLMWGRGRAFRGNYRVSCTSIALTRYLPVRVSSAQGVLRISI